MSIVIYFTGTNKKMYILLDLRCVCVCGGGGGGGGGGCV